MSKYLNYFLFLCFIPITSAFGSTPHITIKNDFSSNIAVSEEAISQILNFITEWRINKNISPVEVTTLHSNFLLLQYDLDQSRTYLQEITSDEKQQDCNFLLMVRTYWIAYTINQLWPAIQDILFILLNQRTAQRTLNLGDIGDIDDLIDEYNDYKDGKYNDNGNDDNGNGNEIKQLLDGAQVLITFVVHMYNAVINGPKGLQNILLVQEQYTNCIENISGDMQ